MSPPGRRGWFQALDDSCSMFVQHVRAACSCSMFVQRPSASDHSLGYPTREVPVDPAS
jgi:hypothetical protein